MEIEINSILLKNVRFNQLNDIWTLFCFIGSTFGHLISDSIVKKPSIKNIYDKGSWAAIKLFWAWRIQSTSVKILFRDFVNPGQS